CDGELTDEEAMQFAKAHANSGNLFLWLQNGVVSMARVVRDGTKFARLTSIVTERAARGNGYAKMLVGELSKRLLAEGLTPVLYARSENPSSNRCYLAIGFEKAGEICEFYIQK
ncbi:MAG: GNAT family N-acetyltransferase, partial [Clostridiales bacterium]|nr:GNAT family N-acetyltransferase [Clostridiales bacterium]